MKINASEVKALSGKEEVVEAATYLQSLYKIQYIAITDGPHHAVIYY